MIDKLYNAKSYDERDTLSQLKNDFGHRNVTTDVMNSFNHVENFIRFATEAHIVYLILDICGMEDLSQQPVGIENIEPDQLESYLFSKCQKLVDQVWQFPSISTVHGVMDCVVKDTYVNDNWCRCKKGKYFVNSNKIHYLVDHSLLQSIQFVSLLILM